MVGGRKPEIVFEQAELVPELVQEPVHGDMTCLVVRTEKHLEQLDQEEPLSMECPSQRREFQSGKWQSMEIGHCAALETWLRRAPYGTARRHWRLQILVVEQVEEVGLQVWASCLAFGGEPGVSGTSRMVETAALPKTTAHGLGPYVGT